MNTPLGIRIAIWTWFFAALAAGRFALWQQAPALALPATLFILAGLLVLAYRLVPPFHTWVDGAGLRMLVLLHATRFVGFYFLVLQQRGDLPARIAVPGGLGDCTVALFAILLTALPLAEPTRRRAIAIWNVAGCADLVWVVVSAVRLELAAPGSLQPFTHLPLSLLPTFLYPLLLAVHVAVFARLARAPR
ncbi:hypothetical protein [Opitutus terrae]|uniref:Uncharacterized protein n=1 Tax=Opitutus terrae (strain DSM 11246 / JCM 15787 / PB90-1) TaxID=452637 RepID=B1ZT54_OPITP|nr:hypothetical protein [Opitutus terrae]ACB75843.1 conserved hypothetical protein [Opitutus terrae PB90-1]